MELSDVKQFLEDNKGSEEVKQFLDSLVKTPNIEEIIKNPEIMKFVDQKVSQGINTYKEKTMPGLIEQEKKKLQSELNPTDSPEMQRIKELEKQLADRDRSTAIANRKSSITKLFSEKNLPTEIVDFIVADTDEDTEKRASIVEEALGKYVTKLKEEFMKGHETVVPKKNDNQTLTTSEEPGPNATKEEIAAWTRKQMRQGRK